MKLKRKIESDLLRYIDTDYALLLTGRRQVGKTYILSAFVSTHFPSHCILTMHNNVGLVKTILVSRD